MFDDLALEILENGVGPDSRSLEKILRSVRGESSMDSTRFELKIGFAPGPAEWAEFAKDIVAFANSGGGVVMFGVADDGTKVGLNKSLLAMLDAAQITDQLRRNAPGAAVASSYSEVNFYSKRGPCLRGRKTPIKRTGRG